MKPSLPCSSGLSAAALPMIRHLILLLVRGQSCPTHVSCQSHPLCPPTWVSHRSVAENSAPSVSPKLCLTLFKLEAFQ